MKHFWLGLFVLVIGITYGQGLSGKYQHISSDGQVLTLLIQEHDYGPTGYLTPAYGLRFDLEVDVEQSSADYLSGQLASDEPLSFEARLQDSGLAVTLAGTEDMFFERLSLEPLTDPSGFLEMLQFIPDDSSTRDGLPFVQYIDLWALFEAYHVPIIRSQADYDAWGSSDHQCGQAADPFAAAPPLSEAAEALLPALRRAVFMADNFASIRPLAEKFVCMPETVGFSFFDIQALLQSSIGRQNNETIIAAETNQDSLQAALSARGFEHIELADVATFSRFDDGAINLRERNNADPFGGSFGRAARIAVLNQLLVSSSSNQGLLSQLEAYQHKRPSLAQAPDIRSLISSLEAYGTIIQAGFFNTIDIGFSSSDPLSGLLPGSDQAELTLPDASPDEVTPLPFFGLSLLAEVNADGQQVTLWALLYEDRHAAEQALHVLPSRLAASLARMEGLAASLVAPQLREAEAGFVVVFGLQHDWLRSDQGNSALSRWLYFMSNRDFQLLALN